MLLAVSVYGQSQRPLMVTPGGTVLGPTNFLAPGTNFVAGPGISLYWADQKLNIGYSGSGGVTYLIADYIVMETGDFIALEESGALLVGDAPIWIGSGGAVPWTNGFVGIEITNGLASLEYVDNVFSSIGAHSYFYGSQPTNISGINSTNVFWANSVPSSGGAVTSAVVVLSNDYYFAACVSRAQYYSVQAGAAEVEVWGYESGAGSTSFKPEFYLWDGTNLVEIGTTVPQALGATAAKYTFSINVAATNCLVPVNFVTRWKASSVSLTPTAYFISEGDYDSHMSVSVPAESITALGYSTNLASGASATIDMLLPSRYETVTGNSAITGVLNVNVGRDVSVQRVYAFAGDYTFTIPNGWYSSDGTNHSWAFGTTNILAITYRVYGNKVTNAVIEKLFTYQ